MKPEETLNKLLRNSVDLILDQPGYALRGRQNTVTTPKGPYAAVNYIASRRYGTEQFTDENRTEDPDLDRTISVNREWMFSISFYKYQSSENDGFLPEDMDDYENIFDHANRVNLGLARESVGELFQLVGAGLLSRSNVRDLSEGTGGYWKFRYAFDVSLHTIGADEEIVRAIDTLSAHGEFQARGKSFPATIEV